MRLSEWRAASRYREATGPKVMAVVDPVLAALGTETDPQCWLAWGEDPSSRYLLMVPTPPGLVVVVVRVNVPGEGPRASAKLVRWSKVQVGELAVETTGEHRLLSFQVEAQVLKGADANADAIARFSLVLLAAIDGRPWPSFDPPAGRRGGRTARGRAATQSGGRKSAGTAGAKRPASPPKVAKAPTAATATAATKRAATTTTAAPKRLGPGR
ncbi:MAG: hypothetical protein ACHQ3P_04260 [Candidatus Limnocylindrales bacterium]